MIVNIITQPFILYATSTDKFNLLGLEVVKILQWATEDVNSIIAISRILEYDYLSGFHKVEL